MGRWRPARARIENRAPGGLWWRIPIVTVLWLVIAAPQVILVAGYVVLRDYASGLPSTPNLERWEQAVPRTSRIVAADGTVLAEIPFRVGKESGHRFPVAYRDIPQQMIRAVLAAEDVRFFQHKGVDMQAVVRAALANYRAGHVVEGASTITQQVARNLLPVRIGSERSLRRKVREALLARRIERRYSKQRIFEVYVNHAFLGASAYGITAAARAYFSRSLAELSLAETAMIAGLAQAPGLADPNKNLTRARTRRDEVLARMHRAGFIDAAALARARAEAITLRPPPVLYGTLAPWHTEWARQQVQETFPADYARGGLIIETAARPVVSAAAETLARQHAKRLGRGRKNGAPQVGAIVMDHTTNYVEATIGGLSWADSRFDRSTQACRQPGSAFKPVVYGAALESDVITPGTALRDAPIAAYDERLGVHWKPTNSGRAFRGVALAQDALAQSLNAPAVDVYDRAGAKRVINFARRLGITTKLAEVRPMALGASCVRPIELATAFATIARHGLVADPVFVVRVRRGSEVLYDSAAATDPRIDPARRFDRLAATLSAPPKRAVDERTAFLLSSMLRDVIKRGTGTDARNLGRPAAGKTGTTNDNSDAWFVGYTGRVVAAVWIGHDDPARRMGPRDGGSHAALPLWKKLVRLAEADRAKIAVPGEPPAGLVRARVDRETGLLAEPHAGGAIDLYFKRGTEPTQRVGRRRQVPTSLGRVGREF